MAIRSTSCSNSLEEEEWRDRPEEAVEEEESMAANGLPRAAVEQGDEERNYEGGQIKRGKVI
jgi:hypothetical protein